MHTCREVYMCEPKSVQARRVYVCKAKSVQT